MRISATSVDVEYSLVGFQVGKALLSCERQKISGAVAQLGEHLPCTQGVVGSSPIRSIPQYTCGRRYTRALI